LCEQLARNAREALADGPGEIELRAGSPGNTTGPPPLLCYPEVRPAGPLVCLEVCDSGPGLSAEAQAHLFEPFFSTPPGRRGIGLATVFGIVRKLKGAIEVFSAPGRGSTFRILLPAATLPAPSARAAGPPALASPAWRARGTVLLADDEG